MYNTDFQNHMTYYSSFFIVNNETEFVHNGINIYIFLLHRVTTICQFGIKIIANRLKIGNFDSIYRLASFLQLPKA